MRYIRVLLFAFILTSLSANAQTNRSFKKGYHGSFEFGAGTVNGHIQKGFVQDYTVPDVQYSDQEQELDDYTKEIMKPGEMIRLSTIHGYSWGNGMFLGAGCGCNFELTDGKSYSSVFVDAKYNIKDAAVSPFIEGRTGYSFRGSSKYSSGGVFVSTVGGVDFGRLSVRLGYEYCPIRQNFRTRSGHRYPYYYSMNQLFLTLSFNL